MRDFFNKELFFQSFSETDRSLVLVLSFLALFSTSDLVGSGLGSTHTLGVSLVSAAVGGMCSTWVKFSDVVAGGDSGVT